MAKRNLQYETVETVQLTPLQEQNVINILVLIKEIDDKQKFNKGLKVPIADNLLERLLGELKIAETQITLNRMTTTNLSLFETQYKNTIFLDINILKSYICYTRSIIARDLFPSITYKLIDLFTDSSYYLRYPKEENYEEHKDFLNAERMYFYTKDFYEKIINILKNISHIQIVGKSIINDRLPKDLNKSEWLDLYGKVEVEKKKLDCIPVPLYIFTCPDFSFALTEKQIEEYKEWSRIHKERFYFLYNFTKETYTNLGLNLPDTVVQNIFNGLINNSFIKKDSDFESFKFLMKGGETSPASFTPINFLETKYCGLFFYCISHFYYDDANVKWNNFIHFIHSKGKKITKKTAGNTKNIAGNKVVAYERGETSLDKNEQSVYNLLKTVLKKR